MLQENPRPSGVLGKDGVGGLERLAEPGRGITQVADRGTAQYEMSPDHVPTPIWRTTRRPTSGSEAISKVIRSTSQASMA